MPYLTKTFSSCFIVLVFFLPATMHAQVVENTINLYGANFPQEKIAAYSPAKEFNNSDYSQSNTTSTDARTTLLWQLYIVTDATNQKVPVTFYNNDFTKKIKIVLEGFNDEGKLIHIEKIIE